MMGIKMTETRLIGPMMTQASGDQGQNQSLYLVYYPQKDNKHHYLSFKVEPTTTTIQDLTLFLYL